MNSIQAACFFVLLVAGPPCLKAEDLPLTPQEARYLNELSARLGTEVKAKSSRQRFTISDESLCGVFSSEQGYTSTQGRGLALRTSGLNINALPL